MVNETSDRPRLTAKGARTRARMVEEAAALVPSAAWRASPSKTARPREVSGSQMYHYFPDKNEISQAVIDYQAETIIKHQR